MSGATGLDRPVFVVGAPRSGTTLVQAALDRHPDLAVHPETHFLTRWLVDHPGLRRGEPGAFERFWRAYSASRFFTWSGLDAETTRRELTAVGTPDAVTVFTGLLDAFRRARGAVRGGEKTPDHFAHVSTLLRWYPHARIVWLLRDPRAVAASLLDFEQDWATDDAEEACRGWRHAATELRRWRDDPRVRVVRYERLVTAPRPGLRSLLDFIQLAWDPAVVDDTAAERGFRHGGYDPWGPIRAGGVDRWRQALPAPDLAIVESLVRDQMRRLGYEPVTTRTRLVDRGRRWWRRARRVAATRLGHG